MTLLKNSSLQTLIPKPIKVLERGGEQKSNHLLNNHAFARPEGVAAMPKISS